MLKNNNFFIIMIVLQILISCKGNLDFPTGFHDVDNKYKFGKKLIVQDDSLSQLITWFYIPNSDSIYSVINDSKNHVSRGWLYKKTAVGDWLYENSDKNSLDSIVNYITYCENVNKNTVKKYVNNTLNFEKGNFYNMESQSEINKLNKPTNITMKLFFDHKLYEECLQVYLFKEKHRIRDFCNYNQYSRDSMPVVDNLINLRITPTSFGRNTVQGYYLLLNKGVSKNRMFTVSPVFFDIILDVEG
ncbi:hypothetical protein [Flavobacterium sp. JP2137]|uniref:hypothetical protein n=1 Tax=Flavobacterium sp. JP2137 TaxID=3414510 RepID=UPI003D2FA4CE